METRRSLDQKNKSVPFFLFFCILLLVVSAGCSDDPSDPSWNTGWVVGSSTGDGYGVILHTDDGGVSWVRQAERGGAACWSPTIFAH